MDRENFYQKSQRGYGLHLPSLCIWNIRLCKRPRVPRPALEEEMKQPESPQDASEATQHSMWSFPVSNSWEELSSLP